MIVGSWDELIAEIARRRIPAASFQRFLKDVYPAWKLLAEGTQHGAARLGRNKATDLQMQFAAMLALHYAHGQDVDDIYGYHDTVSEGMHKALGTHPPVNLNLRRVADRHGDQLLALAEQLSYRYPSGLQDSQLGHSPYRQSSRFKRAAEATPQFAAPRRRISSETSYSMFGLPSPDELANE